MMMKFRNIFADPSQGFFSTLKSVFESTGCVGSIVDKVRDFLPIFAVFFSVLFLDDSDAVLEIVST